MDTVDELRAFRLRRRKDRKALGEATASERGCICPPTSERTCENPQCPRRDHRSLGQKIKDSGGVFNG